MSDRRTLVVSFAVFFGIGLVSAAYGPALPDLADQTGSKLSALGALFTASFLGTMSAQMASGPVTDRVGQRPVLLAGLLLGALGTLVVYASRSLWLTLAGGAVFGMGFGALDVGTNVLIAETFASRSVSILNLLHVFFGIGSVVGPAIVSLTLAVWDTALPAFVAGVAALLLPVPWVLKLPPGTVRAQAAGSGDSTADGAPAHGAAAGTFSYRVPLLWALGLLLLLYVGVESGMGAWTTAYTERSTSFSEEAAALLTSGFWLALTAGRVAGFAFGNRFTPFAVLWACLGGMFVGGALLLIGTGSAVLTVIAVVIIGFWAGPPFPTVIAITTTTFRSGPGKAAGAVVSMASLGAASLPWLQGVILDRAGTAANAVYIAALSTAMLLLYVAIWRRSQRRRVNGIQRAKPGL